MKLTKSKLKQLIKEEIQKVLNEQYGDYTDEDLKDCCEGEKDPECCDEIDRRKKLPW